MTYIIHSIPRYNTCRTYNTFDSDHPVSTKNTSPAINIPTDGSRRRKKMCYLHRAARHYVVVTTTTTTM